MHWREHLLRNRPPPTPPTQTSDKETCTNAYHCILNSIGRCKVMYIIASLCHSVCARLVDSSWRLTRFVIVSFLVSSLWSINLLWEEISYVVTLSFTAFKFSFFRGVRGEGRTAAKSGTAMLCRHRKVGKSIWGSTAEFGSSTPLDYVFFYVRSQRKSSAWRKILKYTL